MSQNDLVYLEALKASETTEALALSEILAGEVKEKRKNMLYNLSVELEIPGVNQSSAV